MENQIESNSSPPPSPKKRRRSSFFERRQSIAVIPQLPETTQEQLRNQRLEEYSAALRREKVAWKKFYQEKKAMHSNKIKEKKNSITEKMTVETLYSLMKEEDKEFLQSGPNLEEVWMECKEACSRANTLMLLTTRLCGSEGGERYQEYITSMLAQTETL